MRIDRGERLTGETAAALTQYKAYAFSESGRSPYAPPGTPGVWAEITGNEHDEWGHVTVNPANRVRMMQKRMEKMVHARDELPRANHFGPADAKVGILSYGSTRGPVREAQGLLLARDVPTRYLQPRTLYPVPVPEIDPFLQAVDVCYVVEHNYTGQFAHLLREAMPWHYQKLRSITKYDGSNFRAPEIVAPILGGR